METYYIFSVVKNTYRKLATQQNYDQTDIVTESLYSVNVNIFPR